MNQLITFFIYKNANLFKEVLCLNNSASYACQDISQDSLHIILVDNIKWHGDMEPSIDLKPADCILTSILPLAFVL